MAGGRALGKAAAPLFLPSLQGCRLHAGLPFFLPSPWDGSGEGPRMKKDGPPGGGPPVSPGEGTDQKLTVMPVTKAVPSFVPCSPEMIEVFDETPGASV